MSLILQHMALPVQQVVGKKNPDLVFLLCSTYDNLNQQATNAVARPFERLENQVAVTWGRCAGAEGAEDGGGPPPVSAKLHGLTFQSTGAL